MNRWCRCTVTSRGADPSQTDVDTSGEMQASRGACGQDCRMMHEVKMIEASAAEASSRKHSPFADNGCESPFIFSVAPYRMQDSIVELLEQELSFQRTNLPLHAWTTVLGGGRGVETGNCLVDLSCSCFCRLLTTKSSSLDKTGESAHQ